MQKVRKLYICNGERCGDKCSYPTCRHTTQLYFAKYKNGPREWLVHIYSDGSKLQVEKERKNEKEKGN